MSGEPLILSARQLVYRYASQEQAALRKVDLPLLRGQALGLLGPNGSGKSTLISLLAGLRSPQSGSITYPAGVKPVIGWVPQDLAFYPDLTCLENLMFFSGMLDLPPGEARLRIEEVLSSCLLREFADRRAGRCSGGMQRRLNLAIAMLKRPDVLLLDEPTVGVDPQSRNFLLDRVRDMVRAGMTVLYATHYMEEVAALCSHVVVLDRGSVLAHGALAELLAGHDGGPPFRDLESLFLHYTDRSLRD